MSDVEMRFGVVQPKEQPADYAGFVSFVVDNDFQWAELKHEPGMDPQAIATSRKALELGLRLKEAGVGVSVHARHTGVNIGSTKTSELEDAMRAYWQSLEFAAALGAAYLTVHGGHILLTPHNTQSETDIEKMKSATVSTLAMLVKDAAHHEITVSLENLTAFGGLEKRRWPKYPSEMRECRSGICASSGRDRVSYTVDTGHLHGLGHRPELFIRELGAAHVRLAHIHDNDGSADQHGIPGTGTIDFPALLHAYAAEQWQFPWLFEVSSREAALESRERIRALDITARASSVIGN